MGKKAGVRKWIDVFYFFFECKVGFNEFLKFYKRFYYWVIDNLDILRYVYIFNLGVIVFLVLFLWNL